MQQPRNMRGSFFVHIVHAGTTPEDFVLDGRCFTGPLRPGHRFTELCLVEFDESTGTTREDVLASVEIEVVEIFSYGKVRKWLDASMTGRLKVRCAGGEPPFDGVLLR